VGTKPLAYSKFTKDPKWLLKQVWGQGIVVQVLGGQVFAPEWHSR